MEKAKGPRSGDVSVSTRKMPEVGLEYVRKLRDVKYSETIFELMAKQYEIAKVDEAKNTSMIQVLDTAVPPERKSKPKRANTVIISTLMASFMAMLLAFVRAAMAKATSAPTEWRFFGACLGVSAGGSPQSIIPIGIATTLPIFAKLRLARSTNTKQGCSDA